MSDNKLTGTLPKELSKLIHLVSLDASINKLTGNIPVQYSKLVALDTLLLNDNRLSGLVPTALNAWGTGLGCVLWSTIQANSTLKLQHEASSCPEGP